MKLTLCVQGDGTLVCRDELVINFSSIHRIWESQGKYIVVFNIDYAVLRFWSYSSFMIQNNLTKWYSFSPISLSLLDVKVANHMSVPQNFDIYWSSKSERMDSMPSSKVAFHVWGTELHSHYVINPVNSGLGIYWRCQWTWDTVRCICHQAQSATHFLGSSPNSDLIIIDVNFPSSIPTFFCKTCFTQNFLKGLKGKACKLRNRP